MCGICGKINTHGEKVSESLISEMSSVLSHRGPDDEGIFISTPNKRSQTVCVGIGHKRLSIMDLSKSGQQPMSNEEKNIWMVFNGEIYNYKELKQGLQSRGHQFISNTDCEAILHLYEEKGIDCLAQLNGMFAFALWDARDESLFLCRDRIGIKPLVYSWDGKSLLFASEIRSLLKDPAVSRDIDFDALNLYLSFNYIPAPYTIYKNIKKLEPGYYLKLKDKQISTQQYWAVNDSENGLKNIDDIKAPLFELLEDAVKIRLMADVPLGAFLSGGIDSSIIVGLMSRVSSSQVSTYSIGFEDVSLFDETAYAKEVAKRHNTDHHEIKLNSKNLIELFTELLCWFDEPFADSSAIPTFIVSRETRKHVKVALSGDGGDELFAGYRMYSGERLYNQYKSIPRFLRRGLIEPFITSMPDSRDKKYLEYIRRAKKFIKGAADNFEDRFYGWNEIFSRPLQESLLAQKSVNFDLGKSIVEKRLNTINSDNINRMLYTDLTHSLPNDMLTKVDWMSMKTSLEVRIPMLDHRVVEFASKLPGNIKMHHNQGKYILFETFKDILPPSLLKRPKWGFEIPISLWLKSDLKFLIEDYLSKEKIVKQGIFNYTAVEQLISDLLSNRRDTSWQLWNLIVFQAWHANLK